MSHRTHHGRQIDQHAERVFRNPALAFLFAAGIVCIVAELAGCAGGGPLGTGLGESKLVVDTKPDGSCHAEVTNGKDQTGLRVAAATFCGGSVTGLAADRSDGATAAINANRDVAQHAIDVGAGLAGDALTVMGAPHGGPKPVPPPVGVPPPPPPVTPPPVGVPPPLPPFPPASALPMLESPEP